MINVTDMQIPGPHGPIPIRKYEPADPTASGLVWMHGGAFKMGDLDIPEADNTARVIADAGITVVSVDYRLAVDGVHFPIPLDDCLAAWRWATEQRGISDATTWHVGGGSAGGNLAAALTGRLRDEGGQLPASNVLIYPVMHPVPPRAGEELASALLTIPEEARFDPAPARELSLNYVGDEKLLEHPWAFPINAEPDGLPPTLIVTSALDSLRPSGEQYAARLAEGGVDVSIVRETGVLHGHLNDPTDAGTVRTLARMIAWMNAAVLFPHH